MSRISKPLLVSIAAILAAVLAIGAMTLLHGGGEADRDLDGAAQVTLGRIEAGPIPDAIEATGVLQADPGGEVTIAAPRAAVVQAVLVRPGQAVLRGEPLVRIGDSPASALAYAQAQHALDFSERDLTRVRHLAARQLVGADQLNAAQRAFADAQAQLAAARAQGAGDSAQVLKAPTDAVVLTTPVAPGDRVAEMADLVTLSGDKAAVARLWVSPTQASKVQAGDQVTLWPVFGGPEIAAHLSHVGKLVDPSTKQIDAEAPTPGWGLPVGTSVSARIVAGSHSGLSVPAASVVYDDTGSHIFVVAGGKASRVDVTIGRQFGPRVEIKGDISAGQNVAVAGAYQLQDGMSVRLTRP